MGSLLATLLGTIATLLGLLCVLLLLQVYPARAPEFRPVRQLLWYLGVLHGCVLLVVDLLYYAGILTEHVSVLSISRLAMRGSYFAGVLLPLLWFLLLVQARPSPRPSPEEPP